MTSDRPQFNRCDSCGRNPHKVAVRWHRHRWNEYTPWLPEAVNGYCPSCFEKVEAKSERPYTVLYDHRKRGR